MLISYIRHTSHKYESTNLIHNTRNRFDSHHTNSQHNRTKEKFTNKYSSVFAVPRHRLPLQRASPPGRGANPRPRTWAAHGGVSPARGCAPAAPSRGLACHATAGCRPAPKLICTGGWPRLALAPALLRLAHGRAGPRSHPYPLLSGPRGGGGSPARAGARLRPRLGAPRARTGARRRQLAGSRPWEGRRNLREGGLEEGR